MGWVYLMLSGLAEVIWAISMKYTEGLTRLWPTLFMLAMLGVTIIFNALAVKHLPLGTAYAVWTGIGMIGTVAFGMIWLGEPAHPARLAYMGLILVGVIGLRTT